MDGTKKTGTDSARVHMPLSWLAVVLVLAAILRLASWSSVFTPEGIRFLPDGDPYYHVIRAKQLALDHRIDWIDPALNHPNGALVLWPPLFDAVIAVPSWVIGGLHPTAETVETCAAFVPVVLGVAGVGAGAFLAAEIMGGTPALIVALLLAVLPAHVRYSVLGRPDQHVLESLLLTLFLVAFLRGLGTARAGHSSWFHSLLLALALTASLWTWVGSPLNLVVLSLIVAVGYVLAEPPHVALRGVQVAGAGCAAATVLLALVAALFAPPGAVAAISLQGISGFQPVLTAAVALWCGVIIAMEHFSRAALSRVRRGAMVLVAGLVVGAVFWFVSRDLRSALLRGLLALNRGNEWYKYITEFSPLLFGPHTSLASELKEIWSMWGLVPLFAVYGVCELAELWRTRLDRRPQFILLALVGCFFTILLVYMSRFAYYSVVPLAIFAALGIIRTSWLWAGRLPLCGIAAMALAPCLPLLLSSSWSSLRSSRIAAVLSPLRQGIVPRSGGIMSRWDMGHDIRYFSGLPVVASPFGTDGGAGSIEDASRFYLETDESAAEQLLLRRDVRYVLLADPANAVLESIAMLRPENPVVKVIGDRYRGFSIKCYPGYDRLLASRLFFSGGTGGGGEVKELSGFRLVSEVGPPGGPPALRLFEVVSGVRLAVTGAPPGKKVIAATRLTTPLGTFLWQTAAMADAAGQAQIRLPYATNTFGNVTASPYFITAGTATVRLVVLNEAVEQGRGVSVVLRAESR